MAFEKLTCYFHECVTKQRLNAELNMSHCSQHMHDGVYNLVNQTEANDEIGIIIPCLIV